MAYTRPLYLTNPTMKGNDVKEVQTRLSQIGFYTGSIDSSFGPATKQAIIKFQADTGLSQDGSCGPATWNRLFYLNKTNPMKHGTDIRKMQQRLKDLGYFTVAVDGAFGNISQNSVKAFQAKNGLTQDGSCGPITWNKLFSSSALSLAKANRILSTAGNSGMFAGNTVTFTEFEAETSPMLISLFPSITVKAKISRSTYIGMTGKQLSVNSSDFKSLSATAISKFASAGVKFNFTQQMLLNTFLSMNFKLNSNELLTYKIEAIPNTNTTIMTLEHKRTIENTSVYVSLILTVDMKYALSSVKVPVVSSSPSTSRKIFTAESIITFALITAAVAGGIYFGQWYALSLLPAMAQ